MPRESVKSRIVAIVRRAKEIDGDELFNIIYQNHQIKPNRNVLKAHIWQLRKQGFPIFGTSRTPSIYCWNVVK